MEGLGHALHAIRGHVAVLWAARPIADWLADPQTPEALQERLRLAEQMRRFAVETLGLPDSPSYRRYADLGRPAVVWNVVAAPSDRLELKTWCYPIAGCVGYRGYFQAEAAQAQAAALAAQGWEVSVYPVRAYSTLGRTQWLGGDPLLNTFALGHPLDLAALLFHEMAHERVYVPDDLAFNEAYATAVERLGLQQWRAEHGPAAMDRWDLARERREQLMERVRSYRDALRRRYAAGAPRPIGSPQDAALEADRQSLRRAFEQDYAAMRDGAWAGDRRWDAWVAGLNNAVLALLGGYQDGVPAFEALFNSVGRDWSRFHRAVEALARAPTAERLAWLQGHPVPAGVLGGP